jgi:hypothetical protein
MKFGLEMLDGGGKCLNHLMLLLNELIEGVYFFIETGFNIHRTPLIVDNLDAL